MLLPQVNFPEDTFPKIGHKVAKTWENFFHENILQYL